MVKIIFFQAHPDDLEHKCGHLMHYLATKGRKKYDIKIASMTKGEFGLPGPQFDKFKGEFLAKIRTRELFKAEKIHGLTAQNIDFFSYIDGFVPFNKNFVNKIVEYLKKEEPDIIIAPEAIYSWYHHMDHINTGRALFYILDKKLIDFRPILYFYTSLCPNFFFGFTKKDIKTLTYKLIACHKTQQWLLRYTMLPYRTLSRFAGRKLHGWKYAEPYRRVYFNKGSLYKNKQSLLVRIFTHFFSSLPWTKAKYPQDKLLEFKMNIRKK
ncbi:MAG: PIG-L deacetylase family protein [Candidatus Hermodarchaeota archaeon]